MRRGLNYIQPGDNPTDNVVDPFHRDYMINTIRWLHTTQLRWIAAYNSSNATARAGAERIQKAMGYRFVIDAARFTTRADPDGSFEVELTVRNEGSAPFYYDWPLVVSLLDPQSLEPVWTGAFDDVDIRDWLPGSEWPEPNWSGTDQWGNTSREWPENPTDFTIPALPYTVSARFNTDLAAGQYLVAISIADPAGGLPAVRFANANYLNGGRYPIGRLAIGTGLGGPLLTDFTFDDPYTDDSLRYEDTEPTMIADFSVFVDSALTGHFNAGSSIIDDTLAVSYAWDFDDDGMTDATGPTAAYTYSASGSYLARLTIQSADGVSRTTSRRFTVSEFNSFGNDGLPWPLPGRIEAENFDTGGPGVAYSDNGPGNQGGAYRNEGVDLQSNNDGSGGINVGWIAAGEWLQYTVRIARTGNYRFDFRTAAHSATGSIRLSIDGIPIADPLPSPPTGGWQVFQTISMPTIPLTAGDRTFRLTFPNGNFNLNWWEATLIEARAFDTWIDTLEAAPPFGQRGPMDDPSGDGMPNLLVYALGGHPMLPGSAQMPELKNFPAEADGPGTWRFTYEKAAPELTYQVEFSENLAPDSWQILDAPERYNPTDGYHFRSFSPTANNSRQFFRLSLPEILSPPLEN